jgi:hypothetical protein
MAEDIYTFDEEGVGRIVDVVRAVEADLPTQNYRPPKPRRPPAVQTSDVQVIRVTSTTPTGNGYPAFIEQVQNTPSGVTYTDLGACYALDPNNGSLSAVKYQARRTGNAPDGNPVFTVVNVSSGLTVQLSDSSIVLTGITTLILDLPKDWQLSNPQPGVAQVRPVGLTTSRTYLADVSCNSDGTLSKTYGTDVFTDGNLTG